MISSTPCVIGSKSLCDRDDGDVAVGDDADGLGRGAADDHQATDVVFSHQFCGLPDGNVRRHGHGTALAELGKGW
jgi:hypothetical protein